MYIHIYIIILHICVFIGLHICIYHAPGQKFRKKNETTIGRRLPNKESCWDAEMQKQWNGEVVRCINGWANGCWDANDMTWKNPCTAGRMNQWTNKAMNQQINESTNQWSNEPVNQWIGKSIIESMNQWFNESLNHEPMNQLGMTQGISEPMSLWPNESIDQWISH